MNRTTDEHPAGSPETWLDEHGSALYRYALVQLRDPHKAEDAVQDALWVCVSCRRFEQQLELMRRAMRLRRRRAETAADGVELSPEARERIRKALEEQRGQARH